MNILTESLAEEAVQAVQEAGSLPEPIPPPFSSIRTKGETDYVTNVDLAVQELSAGAPGRPGPGCPVYGRRAGQYGAGLEPPLLDSGPGGRHHQPDPQFPAQRRFPWRWRRVDKSVFGVVYNPYSGGVLHRPPGRRSASEMAVPIRVSDVLPGWRTASCPRGPSRAAGSWRTPLSGRCGRCMTGARTSAAPAAPAWTCAGWPADGWTAMWSCLSSPGTTPPECCIVAEAGGRVTAPDGSPLSLCGRAALCWPPMGGSTARCKQF